MSGDDLDSIKSNPEVLKIYGRYTKLKRLGTGYQGKCPLHSDSSPSFSVYPDMRWTCFSGCGSGNIFQLVEKLENIPFKEAVDFVKKEIGSDWESSKEKVDRVFRPVAEVSKVYRTISLEAWAKTEAALADSAPAKKYLADRGITYETAKKLHFGFVQDIKTLANGGGEDICDKGWVALPYIDESVVRMVKFRSIVRKRPGGFARQPNMETCLFNTNTIDVFEPVYLVEGEYDAAILEQVGFHAVSICSASTYPTAAHKDQLMKSSAVILAGDNDGGAGNKVMDKLWRELGSGAYRLLWPDGMKDANECLLKHCKGDNALFKALVEDLTRKAKSQPMPSVYNLKETMEDGGGEKLVDRADRFRFPQPTIDDMLIILPGHVFGFGSTETGMGKTMFIVQATLHNAIKYGKTVINFQAEMSPTEIAGLATCQLLRVDRNEMTKDDMKKAAPRLENVNYYVGRDPNITELKEVLDLIESAVRRLSPDIVVLDHFHHFSAGADNETKQQADAMTRIKKIAELYQVIFINIGQPSKPTRSAASKPLRSTDFRGSGAWGQAANSIMAIHRDYRKTDDTIVSGKGNFEDKTLVQVIKGRSLGKGKSSCFVTCFGEFCCFEEIDTSHQEYEE